MREIENCWKDEQVSQRSASSHHVRDEIRTDHVECDDDSPDGRAESVSERVDRSRGGVAVESHDEPGVARGGGLSGQTRPVHLQLAYLAKLTSC